jgi:hypothetical protein
MNLLSSNPKSLIFVILKTYVYFMNHELGNGYIRGSIEYAINNDNFRLLKVNLNSIVLLAKKFDMNLWASLPL